MGTTEKSARTLILLVMVLCVVTSAGAVEFYAGVVSEVKVSQEMVSERWTGISGTVERGDEPITDHQIGLLGIEESQTGEVLNAELEAIQGGGYYLAFTPGDVTIDSDNLMNISAGDLEDGGIFSKQLFPDFYPDYSQRFDNPQRTFQPGGNLKIDGQFFNVSQADLSGQPDMYLLKHDDNGTEVPVFISPVDGLTREDEAHDCYVSGCDFQTLLPSMNGTNFTYSVNLFSRGKTVSQCGQVEENTTHLALDGLSPEDSCIDIVGDQTYVDFYNTAIGGREEQECALNVQADNVTVADPNLEGFGKAICVDGSGSKIKDFMLNDNSIGITAQESKIEVVNGSMNINNVEMVLQDSKAEMKNLTIDSTPIYGLASAVSIESFGEPLPRPSDINENVEPVGSRVRVNSLSEGASIKGLGLGYPGVNTSKLLPDRLYKYDEIDGSYEMTELEVDLATVEWNPNIRYAKYPGEIKNFSIFSLYGQKLQGETEGGGSGDVEGGGASDSDNPPTSVGPGFQPIAEAPELNLTLDENLYNAKKGDTISLGFSIENTGPVAVENVSAQLENNWSAVPRNFNVIRPNETRVGTILVTVPQNISRGNSTLKAASKFKNTTLDSEELKVNISELVDERRLEVIDYPPFLSLEKGETRFIGLEVENPSSKPLKNVKTSFRSDDSCVAAEDSTYDVPAGSTKNIQASLKASEEGVCNDVLVLESKGEILGYAPMRIEVKESEDSILSLPVYAVILLIWTALTVWRLKSRNNKKQRRFW